MTAWLNATQHTLLVLLALYVLLCREDPLPAEIVREKIA